MNRTNIEEFEAAALPHLPDLFRTASRLTGDRGRAEDVVQEVYLQAWKSFHRFTLGTNCRAWLFKILMNTLHHDRRKWFSLRSTQLAENDFEQTLMYAPPVPEKLTDQKFYPHWIASPRSFGLSSCSRMSRSSRTKRLRTCWKSPSEP